MEKNAKTQTFTLTVNELGQEIYTSQTDKSISYIIDDEGNMTRYCPPDAICAIKLEEGNNKLNEECTEMTLEEASNLGIIHPMETDNDFENNLMNELDSDLINIENDPNVHVIMQHMDIREPLSKLKQLLEQRLGVDLPNYTFCLQGGQTLKDNKNLVDQCVQGQGTVQINVQLQTDLKRINILDVLKPAEDYIEGDDNRGIEPTTKKIEITSEQKAKNIVQWQVDSVYKKEQDRLNIPHDPHEWSDLHVRHWVQWAVRQFNLPNIKLSDWSMTGKELYQLSLTDFHKIVPNDPGDIFWTHLELLRKMKVVAVKKEDTPSGGKRTKLMRQDKINKILPNYPSHVQYYESNIPGVIPRSGTNGQIQLWQFLLELLTTRKYSSAIHWIGTDGQFKLRNPHLVAQLWGERKNKPQMNYEKLSRALRYYYDGDMISKVHGERFVYKFVCDLKQLLGYSATELANLVKYGNPMYNETRPEMFTT